MEDFIKNGRYDVISHKMNRDDSFREYIIDKTEFLEPNTVNMCRIWHIKNDIYEKPKCPQCGEPTNFSKKMGKEKGYNKFCSRSCKMTFINLNRSEEDTIKRKEKIKQTCLERYGVEHYFSSDMVKVKKLETYRQNYGVDNPSKLESVKQKKIHTYRQNYGVDNPSQSVVVQSKKTLTTRSKRIITECGKIYDLDGYEPLAVKELLDNHKPDDILHHTEIVKEIGKIYYNYGDKKSVYHPDIYLKSENKIIEVKSLYWYNYSLGRNLTKKRKCEQLGYNFEFWVYDPKNNLNKTIC